MKNTLLFISLTTALLLSACDKADYEAHKKDTIKFMYRDAVMAIKNDHRADILDTLFAYSDKDLQNSIALVKADAINTYEGNGNDISNCNETRYIFNLTTGNGYSIEEVKDVNYKVLSNGMVRASTMLEGDENIDDSNFEEFKDFSLDCSEDGCKITDIYDNSGHSAKLTVDESCR